MQKKGQVAVFIIIGVVIIVAIGASLMLRKAPGEEVPASMAHIKIFVDQCIKNVGENALMQLGPNGGYLYFESIDALPTYYGRSAYWYMNGYNFAPKNEAVEAQLNRYITENLNSSCLKGFEELHENITLGEINPAVKIMPDKVMFDVECPVMLSDKGTETTISKFSKDVDVRLGRILDVGRKVVEMEMNDPAAIDLTYLSDLELPVGIHPYSDYALFYSVTDDKSIIGGNAYRLVFANKISEDVARENRAPRFIYVGYGAGVPGDHIETLVEVNDLDGDIVKLTDDSDLFDIQQNGSISFVATDAMVGSHDATITADDGKGGIATEIIYFDIYTKEGALE